MTRNPFPKLSYDDVTSEFIRTEIRRGSFEDHEHRAYVNDLVYVEWHTKTGIPEGCTGISAAGMGFTHWRIAARFPKAFDAVRRDLDAKTRAEYPLGGRWSDDADENLDSADRHRAAWNVVQSESSLSDDWQPARSPQDHRPSISEFRFPRVSYDEVESEFVRGEIQRGSFDDLEYRLYVNVLVYVEAWTQDPSLVSNGAYPPVRPWIVAAKYPREYDLVRRDLGAPTRREIEPRKNVTSGDVEEEEELRRRHKTEWVAVQEGETRISDS